MAPEEQEPVFRPGGPKKPFGADEEAAAAEQALADSKKTDAQWAEEFKQAAAEGARRREASMRRLREGAGQQTKEFDWSQFDELMQNWRDNTIPTGARVSQPEGPSNVNTAPENLDVPLAPETEN